MKAAAGKTKEGEAGRRMGPAGSENWHAMLDAAEAILRDEGHATLTSRNVAERVGVKQRLVYYYFRTMDELIIEMFRRSSTRELERLSTAVAAPHPLRTIWDVTINTTDARLTSEFIALANRNEGLRKEVIRFIEAQRAIQVSTIEAAMAKVARSSPIPSSSLTMIATSLGLLLTRENQLGVSSGHTELLKLIENFLDTFEPRD